MRGWAIAFVLVLCGKLCGQSTASVGRPFDFKDVHLGMQLSEFKVVMAGDTVWVNTGKPNIFGHASKKYNKQVPTPLCTDTMREFPGDIPDLKDGEVLCNPSPGYANQDRLTVMGLQLESAIYRFYKSRLYEIDITASPSLFEVLQYGFRTKYGAPRSATTSSYQNGFGASWTGQNLYWERGRESIIFTEGPGNGPGQSAATEPHPSSAMFLDADLQPPPEKPAPLDF